MLPLKDAYLAYYALAMVFGTLSFFTGSRLLRFCRGSWDISNWFHLLVFLHCIARCAAFAMMCFLFSDSSEQPSKNNYPLLYVLINVPDCVFLSTYSLLIMQLLRSFEQGHMQISFSYTRVGTTFFSWGNISLIAFNCCLYVVQGTVILLYLQGKVSDQVDLIVFAILNLVLATFVIIASVAQFYRFNGLPYKSAAAKEKIRKLLVVTAVWTAGRIIRAVAGAIAAANNTPDSFSGGSALTSTMFFMIVFALFVFAEIVPFFMVLDWSFMGILLFSEEDHNLGLPTVIRSMDSLSQSRLPYSWRVESKDLQILEQVGHRNSGLGTVHRGVLKGGEVAVKKLNMQKVSKYVVEELSSELDLLSALEHPFLLPLLGACLESDMIALVCPYLPRRSLFTLLHEQTESTLDPSVNLRIAKELAQVLTFLHQQDPPRIHGHLTSHNVLLSDKLSVQLADVGLERLKKYAGFVSGYSNKSAYTAPEVLTKPDRTTTGAGANTAADVYSFGILLWELYTRTIPFPAMTLGQIRKCVVENDHRPAIPPTCPSKVASLIRACWQTAADQRPSFPVILQRLNGI